MAIWRTFKIWGMPNSGLPNPTQQVQIWKNGYQTAIPIYSGLFTWAMQAFCATFTQNAALNRKLYKMQLVLRYSTIMFLDHKNICTLNNFKSVTDSSMKDKGWVFDAWKLQKRPGPGKTKNIWFGKYCTRKGSKHLSQDIYLPFCLLFYFMGQLYFPVKAI